MKQYDLKKLKLPQNPPQLKLCSMNRKENGTFEAHDPSLMKDAKSEWYYSYSTDTAITSKYEMGVQIRRSKDLITWEYRGQALSQQAIDEGRDNGKYPPTGGFWAPFVEWVDGEYRMYYSATKDFGSSESRIWLAVAKDVEGPFENRGVVMDTWYTDDTLPNAIDAHVIEGKDEKRYLVYGSFFGGIYIKELDIKTGLAKEGPRTLGKCISKKGNALREDGPEGAAIIYNPETSYYYLFQSYGWLGAHYDIRVGRSRVVEGPYQDFKGKSLVEESMGIKLANSYMFEAKAPNVEKTAVKDWAWGGFRGPGHGVPFYDEQTGNYYFAHHIRDGAVCFRGGEERISYSMHYLMIRKMIFLDGWPFLSPEPYAGEDEELIGERYVEGNWEMICLDDNSNDIKYSKSYWVKQQECCYSEETGVLQITIGKNNLKLKLLKCWDFENARPTLCCAGYDQKGEVWWGKYVW